MEIRKIGNFRIDNNINTHKQKAKTEKNEFGKILKDTSEISDEAKAVASGKVNLEEIRKKINDGYYNKPDVIRKTAESLIKDL
ncbi:MAG TPA: hypothetical protein PLI27_09370 [Ignavibacteriales bacterium]|nr:hypothetical protein [Ignavibacteriales bacterium]HOL80185.1 hypothetical protein [Ignavibacteriales bacterium]HOM64467.1 hypothetical protein [Ignavibacteriales bacterium]HPD68268.1 hypothetical protein [Ignavibacteriales bacterium]HPP32374.1 hypothetical protein [Ignavibacteriales bacterium]